MAASTSLRSAVVDEYAAQWRRTLGRGVADGTTPDPTALFRLHIRYYHVAQRRGAIRLGPIRYLIALLRWQPWGGVEKACLDRLVHLLREADPAAFDQAVMP